MIPCLIGPYNSINNIASKYNPCSKKASPLSDSDVIDHNSKINIAIDRTIMDSNICKLVRVVVKYSLDVMCISSFFLEVPATHMHQANNLFA